MLFLILASLLGGIITIACFWHWLGMGTILLAPLGAGVWTILAGVALAGIRTVGGRLQCSALTIDKVHGAAPNEFN